MKAARRFKAFNGFEATYDGETPEISSKEVFATGTVPGT
jgi:hypothetical protein